MHMPSPSVVRVFLRVVLSSKISFETQLESFYFAKKAFPRFPMIVSSASTASRAGIMNGEVDGPSVELEV